MHTNSMQHYLQLDLSTFPFLTAPKVMHKDVNLARSRFIAIFRDFSEIPRLFPFPAPNATFAKYRNFPQKIVVFVLETN